MRVRSMCRRAAVSMVGGVLGWLLVGGALPAEAQVERPDESHDRLRPRAAQFRPTAEQIKVWIEELADDRFVTRQAATKALRRAGLAAIPALKEAAIGPNAERSARAAQILEQLFRNGTGEVKSRAKSALQSVAHSGHGRAAQIARSALKPPEADDTPKPPMIPGMPGIPPIGGIQMRMQAIGGARQVAVTRAGGTTTTTLKEPGLEAKLVEDGKQITLEIKRTQDGKTTTKKYTAKDAAELKRKHPEAYAVHQKMKQNRGFGPIRIQVQAGGGIQGLPFLPPMPGARPAVPGGSRVVLSRDELKEILKRLEKGIEALRSVDPKKPAGKTLEQAIESLEEARKQLEKHNP